MTGQTHITPKTEESLKRLAKRISREQNVPHMTALDLAARQAGSDSYRAFQATLTTKQIEKVGKALISVRWYQYDNLRKRRISAGVAEAEVALPRPFREIFPKSGEWKSARTMADHVKDGVFSRTVDNPRTAIGWTLRTARALQFMTATGLRNAPWPKRGPWVKFGGNGYGVFMGIPGQDHPFFLKDPTTGELLMINEPYVPWGGNEPDRSGWEKADLFNIRPLSWGNLYVSSAPIRSELISLRGHGVDLDEVEARLKAFGPAMTRDEVRVTVTEGTPAPDTYWQEVVG
jgi:hypothetical protein